MSAKRRKRHSPEQIVRKLRDADAMLNAGKDLAAVLQFLEVSESTYLRWKNQYGGMKSEEAKRLKQLEEENKRLKHLVAEKELDIQMLKHVASGNCSVAESLACSATKLTALPGSVRLSVKFNRNSRSPSEGRAARSISREAVSDTKHSQETMRKRW